MAAVIYAEVEFKTAWDYNEHGWSVMVAWIGAASAELAFVFSCALAWLKPSERMSPERVSSAGQTSVGPRYPYEVRYPYTNTDQSYPMS